MPDLSINLLRNVSGVGSATVREFVAAGYESLNDLEDATLDDLLQVSGVGDATAQAILDFLNSAAAEDPVKAYRHGDKRKNIPPAGLAGQGRVEEAPATRYFYDPHLPPVLRFDETGEEDPLPLLLAKAKREPLSADEAKLLAEALRNHQPWLEWAGKREKRWFDVDPVALHIHERVASEAIIATARRCPLQPSLFADPELEYREAIRFYKHEMDWANRLILGDSLTVMHSLARREDLAGKVQMIYIDPPYGINFRSNFQAIVGKREVKDKEADLTREPEQVKAYRDTWTLGVHSYLGYLKDRLIVSKELLVDSGSIFVQISDENLHRVRMIMDDVFGPENFCALIAFTKTSGQTSTLLATVSDFLLWYAKDVDEVKYRQLYQKKELGGEGAREYVRVELPNGQRRAERLKPEEMANPNLLPEGTRIYTTDSIVSEGFSQENSADIELAFGDEKFVLSCGNKRHWKTSINGIKRLWRLGRLERREGLRIYKRYFDDFPYIPFNTLWTDTRGATDMLYVVQTSTKVIERCMLMTTDPGDLVIDPTCGSGSTAYVAEQWGRRWITIDTSRIALSLARQRLLTASYEFYKLSNSKKGVSSGFKNETAAHVTLKSIAQNEALDNILDKWEPILEEKLKFLNKTLRIEVNSSLRSRLQAKLGEKERLKGKGAISEMDRRRWLLPQDKWEAWEVPFDTDSDWPQPLKAALEEYRQAWRAKMDEVNETIAASAPQEVLVDQPKVVKNVLRVSGPFTVEGVQPIEQSPADETPIGGAPDALDQTFEVSETSKVSSDPTNAAAYLEKMVRLLRQDGVRFPDNKVVKFDRLEPLPGDILHAEGEWQLGGKEHYVAVAFGPQYGPITAQQVEECLRFANRRGYDDLVLAGFTIDGTAQAIIQEDLHPRVRTHLAHIRPDVNMGDLLKDTPSSQLFTVFGEPRVKLEQNKQGDYVVTMEGVDIYDPVKNVIHATKASKVAAWFLDADYDGGTFCISQAFFPDKSAWQKLAKALKTLVDPQRFAAFSGTQSLPFPAGEHKRAAVKVIDPRGNEVMRVMHLSEEVRY